MNLKETFRALGGGTMRYKFEEDLANNLLSIDVVDARRFGVAMRAVMRDLEQTAKYYNLTKEPYYRHVQAYLDRMAVRLEAKPIDRKIYQWATDGAPEPVLVETITVQENICCYYCSNIIPAGSAAMELRAEAGDIYVLHECCARSGLSKISHTGG